MMLSRQAGHPVAGSVRAILLALYPLIVLTSETTIESGHRLPKVVNFAPWHIMWISVHLARYRRNGLLVSTATAFLAKFFAPGGAYVFSCFRFPGRRPFGVMLGGVQAIPAQMLLLLVFIIYVVLQNAVHVPLIGTDQGLILTYLTFALPFSTGMLANYIGGLPQELEDAGMVDGCLRRALLRRIVVPLTVPGMIVASIFSFLLS